MALWTVVRPCCLRTRVNEPGIGASENLSWYSAGDADLWNYRFTLDPIFSPQESDISAPDRLSSDIFGGEPGMAQQLATPTDVS